MTDFDGTTSLDQSIQPYIYNSETSLFENEENHILDLADKVLGDSLEEGNFSLAFGLLRRFRSLNKASGLGNAKLLHGIKYHWGDIESEEEFIDQAVQETGYNRLTIERYISVWEMLSGDYIPSQFKEQIQAQTMRCLVKEASLVVDQGYELEEEEWLSFSEAIDDKTVSDLCAKAKKRPRSKNYMSLKIDNNGDLWAFQNDKQVCIGHLNVNDLNELSVKAINRIIQSSGVTEKNDY